MERELRYTATDDARAAIASIGRTEDVMFSGDGRRLAIAAFNAGAFLVLDIETDFSAGRKAIKLSNAVQMTLPGLQYPHGLAYLDSDSLLVADRSGTVSIVRIPPDGSNEGGPVRVVEPVDVAFEKVRSPGSVAIIPRGGDRHDVLVCNNYKHKVTRHRLRLGPRPRVATNTVLLKNGLNIPDGIAISPSKRWIAVSNHGTNRVLLYRNTWLLNRWSPPAGELRGTEYPHGVRFTADGRHILAADAGAPFVNIYAAADDDWRGRRDPIASPRVMDDETFSRGRVNPEEGGPKGIDIDRGMNVLVMTAEEQPLAFFDLPAILAR